MRHLLSRFFSVNIAIAILLLFAISAPAQQTGGQDIYARELSISESLYNYAYYRQIYSGNNDAFRINYLGTGGLLFDFQADNASVFLCTKAGSANLLGPLTTYMLGLKDTDRTHALVLKWNEDESTDRVLNFLVNGANRTIDLSNDLVISALTNTRLLATDAVGTIVSSDLAAWMTGTANQVTVTDNGDGTITLSTPQDTDATASPTFTGMTLTGDLTVAERTIFSPSATQVIDAAGDAILANSRTVVLNPDADYTLISTPTIADGSSGEVVYITAASGETKRVTVQDQGTLGGSNLQLLSSMRTIYANSTLKLEFNGTDWQEISYVLDGSITEYNVKDFGAVGDDTADDYDAVNATHTAATVNGGTVFFPQGTYKLSDNLTIDSDVTLEFSPGAKLSIDNAKTVTINGHIADTIYQIFSGDGAVAGTPRNDFVRPEWWGAIPDGTTVCTAAIDTAIKYAVTSTIGQVRFSRGIYIIDDSQATESTITTNANFTGYGYWNDGNIDVKRALYYDGDHDDVALIGSGGSNQDRTVITFKDVPVDTFGICLNTSDRWAIRDIWFKTSGVKAKAAMFLYGSSYNRLDNVRIEYFTDHALYLYNTWGNTFISCIFRVIKYPIRSYLGNANVFIGCNISAQITDGVGFSGSGQGWTFLGCNFEGADAGIYVNDTAIQGYAVQNSSGWIISGNYFEAMTDQDIIYLRNAYDFEIGATYIHGANDRLYLSTNAQRCTVLNWPGDVFIHVDSRYNKIINCGGTVTNNDPDHSLELDDVILNDGTRPLTANWDVGAFGITAQSYDATDFVSVFDSSGAPALGDNVVTNPTFDVNTNDWTPLRCTLASVGGGALNNCLEVTSTIVAGQTCYAKQTITLDPYAVYQVDFYVKFPGSPYGGVRIGSADETSDIYNSGNKTDTAWAQYTAYFTPTVATCYLQFYTIPDAIGYISYLDEVKIQRVNVGEFAVGNGISAGGDISADGNLVSSTYNFGADAEASDTYVITLSPPPTAYTTGMMITFTANTANTGACTVNVNTLGAIPLKMTFNQDPYDNYISAGSVVVAVYDGTNFQIIQCSSVADYAGIYASDNAVETVVSLVDTFEHIQIFTADMPESISNAVHGDDKIVFGNTGIYKVAYHICAASAGVNKVYAFFGFEIAASGSTITGATQANPCVITAVGHGFTNGQRVKIVDVEGMTELNGRIYTVANKADDTFELNDDEGVNINSGGYGAWTANGTAYLATRLEAVHIHRKFAVASDVGAASSGALISVTKGNTLEMYVKGLTDDTNLTFQTVQLRINLMGN